MPFQITGERLNSLFRPRSVALVGASDKSTFSWIAYRNLVGAGLGVATVQLARVSLTALLIGIAVSLVASYAVFAVNYLLFAVFLTDFVVVLLALLGLPAGPTAIARLIGTGVGTGLAILAYLLWPTWESTSSAEKLARLFAAQGAYVSNGSSGTATVNLRDLGSARTLVLINGRRMGPGDPLAKRGQVGVRPVRLHEHGEPVAVIIRAEVGEASDPGSRCVQVLDRADTRVCCTAALRRRHDKLVVVLAAVDVQALAGDRPGQRRGQEQDGVRDLVRLRQPPKVRRGGCLGVDVVYTYPALVPQVAEVPLQRLAPDVAGRHRVHPDALRSELGGQAPRHGE